jgi:hypothetical protein
LEINRVEGLGGRLQTMVVVMLVLVVRIVTVDGEVEGESERVPKI